MYIDIKMCIVLKSVLIIYKYRNNQQNISE